MLSTRYDHAIIAPMTVDELIERLRVRTADPARRVDVPQTELGAAIAGMDLGGLFSALQGMAGDLGRMVAANQAGRPLEPALVGGADDLHRSMTTPVRSELPPTATPAALDGLEVELGQRLPATFRRVYGEVADGGFGPGSGLFSLEVVTTTYRQLRADPPAPRGLGWPPGIVPIAAMDPGYICLEPATGRVIDWDPEETDEWQDAEGWASSFRQLAPDLETWLGAWVDARTPSEERQDHLAQLRRDELRRTKERIAAMTPAEREAIGLPAEGWESAFIDEADL